MKTTRAKGKRKGRLRLPSCGGAFTSVDALSCIDLCRIVERKRKGTKDSITERTPLLVEVEGAGVSYTDSPIPEGSSTPNGAVNGLSESPKDT